MLTTENTNEKFDEKLEKIRKRKNKQDKKKMKLWKKILITLLILFLLGVGSGLFLLYGPINTFRDWLITSAMTTMNHQYLATWFYNEETINEVLSRNRVIEVDEITNPDLIIDTTTQQNYANEYEKAVLEKDKENNDYKIIPIKGDTYSGYLAVIYDSSKVKTIVSQNIGKSGQYLVKMAQNNKARVAINGGMFIDPENSSTGGCPHGITISNGKVISNTGKSRTCWIQRSKCSHFRKNGFSNC